MRTLSFMASGLALTVSMLAVIWSIYDPPRPGKHAPQRRPVKPRAEHKTYHLEPIDSLTVAVSCADCPGQAPLAVGQIIDWAMIAETHYREVSNGRG